MATTAQLTQDLINAVAKVRTSGGSPMQIKFSDGKTRTIYNDGSGAEDVLGISFRNMGDQFNAAASALAPKPAAATPISQVAQPAPTPAPAQTTPIAQVAQPAATTASKLAIQGANPDYFPKVNEQGLPILDQKALDAVLAKYGGNKLDYNQYRDNYNKFGWNVKSDASQVLRGAEAFGLTKQTTPMGGGVTYGGDFNKAAQQIGIDISGLKTPEQKYNAINNAAKDYYVVSNSLDRTGKYAGQNTASPHASILFKADGQGNLVPVTAPDGNLAAKYFNATGNVVSSGGLLGDLAPFLGIAGVAFGLPAIMNAIGSAGVSAGTWAAANEAVGLGTAALSPATAAAIGAAALPGIEAGLGTGTMTGSALGTTGATLGNAASAASLAAPAIVPAVTPAIAPTTAAALPGIEAGLGTGTMAGTTLGTTGATLGNTAAIAANVASAFTPQQLIQAGLSSDEVSALADAYPNIVSSSELGSQTFPSTAQVSSAPGATVPGVTATTALEKLMQAVGYGGNAPSALNSLLGYGANAATNNLASSLSNAAISNLVGSGAQAVGSYLGSQAQADAAKQAAANQMSMFNTINQQLAPQRGAGYQALNKIRSLLPGQFQQYDETGKPIGMGTGTDYLTRQFTPQDLQAGLAPNYQFMLGQGQQQAQRQANLSGGAIGGNALRALQDYTQNYAGNAYQNAFSNFQNQRTGIYNTLAGIAGLGQTAQNTAAQAGQNAVTAAGQLGVGAAGAQAAGMTGAANAVAGGLQNYQANQILQQILNQNQNVAQQSTATPNFNVA